MDYYTYNLNESREESTMRLTNNMRGAILKKLISNRFDKEFAKIGKEQKKFADSIYNDAFTKKERDIMSSLKKGWLPTRGSSHVNFAGEKHIINFSGLKLVPYNLDSYYSTIKTYTASHIFIIKNRALINAESELKKQRKDAEADANAILYSVTTVKKLKEVWPEVSGIVDKLTPTEQIVNFPSVVIDDLNKALKLP